MRVGTTYLDVQSVAAVDIWADLKEGKNVGVTDQKGSFVPPHFPMCVCMYFFERAAVCVYDFYATISALT